MDRGLQSTWTTKGTGTTGHPNDTNDPLPAPVACRDYERG